MNGNIHDENVKNMERARLAEKPVEDDPDYDETDDAWDEDEDEDEDICEKCDNILEDGVCCNPKCVDCPDYDGAPSE
jgi:hypothetical protein